MKAYTFLGRSNGRKFCIQGVDVFQNQWRSMGECGIVLDPNDKKPYSFSFYKITTSDKEIVFLAGKFRDDTWGFYQDIPEEDRIF